MHQIDMKELAQDGGGGRERRFVVTSISPGVFCIVPLFEMETVIVFV